MRKSTYRLNVTDNKQMEFQLLESVIYCPEKQKVVSTQTDSLFLQYKKTLPKIRSWLQGIGNPNPGNCKVTSGQTESHTMPLNSELLPFEKNDYLFVLELRRLLLKKIWKEKSPKNAQKMNYFWENQGRQAICYFIFLKIQLRQRG